METVAWVHLGIHDKPCGVLNVDGFFDHLVRFIAHAVETGFIAPQLVDGLVVSEHPGELLDAMAIAYGPAPHAQ
jgi:predicted Rossmann-fold nucleotide-binding protein